MSNALSIIASSTGVSVDEVTDVLKGMIVSAKNQHGATATNAELAVVASVCAKYDLNPLVKEVAAFISGGRLQMIVMIDGWYRIVNRQPEFDGVEFDDHFEDGKLVSTTCRMYLKNRSRPVCVTEYLAECKDPKSIVWAKWPARMLRHKAYIQTARMAFGFSDIIDNDEADRTRSNNQERDITPARAEVDFAGIDADFAECADIETLKDVAGRIRTVLEARGQWIDAKSKVVELHKTHKARIESMYHSDIDDAEIVEFEEANESHYELQEGE